MSIIACSVDGCESPVRVKKRQLCQRHYNRLMYAGTTDVVEAPKNCIRCGAINPPNTSKGPQPSYCSDRCRGLAGYDKRVASGAYAAGLAELKAHRAALPKPVAICTVCGASRQARSANSKFCSQACNNKYLDAANPKRCTAAACDRGVRAKGLCAMHWRRKARADGREANPAWDERRKAHYHKRRALKATTQVEDLEPLEIYERDVWICGLCSTAVDPDLSWPDPMSPSLDHVLPLSKGGTHTYENVQLAHLTCNISKGNRIAA